MGSESDHHQQKKKNGGGEIVAVQFRGELSVGRELRSDGV